MKGLKKLLNYGLVGLLSVALVGCASADDSVGKNGDTKNKLEQVKESKKLVVATSADYPPYEFHKKIDGKDTITGFDVMIAEAIAKELGVELEVKDMKFDGLLASLEAGKSDLILAGMSPTEERKKNVDFSDVYYQAKNVVITRKEDVDKFKDIESLKNAKVGAQKTSIQETFVKDEIGCTNVKAISKITDLILELENKNIDALVVSSHVGDINVSKNNKIALANTNIGEQITEGSAIAFKKDETNKEFVEEVNEILNKLINEGKVDEFVQKSTDLAQE